VWTLFNQVFRGTSNAGPPLDVWALGVILFALLSGRLPFEAGHIKPTKSSGGTAKKSSSLDEEVSVEGKEEHFQGFECDESYWLVIPTDYYPQPHR